MSLIFNKKANPVLNDTIISNWVKLSTKYTPGSNRQYSCFVRAQIASCCAPGTSGALLVSKLFLFLSHLKIEIYHWVSEQLNIFMYTTFCFERVLRFVTEYTWVSQLLGDAVFCWQPGNKFLQFSDQLEWMWFEYHVHSNQNDIVTPHFLCSIKWIIYTFISFEIVYYNNDCLLRLIAAAIYRMAELQIDDEKSKDYCKADTT